MLSVFMDEMVSIWILLALITFLTGGTTDLCDWTGSAVTEEHVHRLVVQVRLRCAAGRILWSSPGPGQALRVVLEPGPSSRTSLCIKPSPSLRGVYVFTERSGRLGLLATGRPGEERVTCVRADETPVIYLEARPHSNDDPWWRGSVGFQYELLTHARPGAAPGHEGLEDPCRPCNNSELLMAVCVSDFVVRGSIQSISPGADGERTLIQVSASRVFRQRGNVFVHQSAPQSPPASWSGHISAPPQCRVKLGDGDFLFTGSERFGRAWLGCAPRFKDFLSVYHSARAARGNPCHFPLD